MRKTIFNMVDGINSYTLQCGTIMTFISSGDWTLNVACGSGIMTVNTPSGSTLQCDTWLWDDMPLNSPGGSTLQCDTWLWDDMPLNSPGGSTLQCETKIRDHGIKFGRWQHPAMWLWDNMPWNSPKRQPYWNSTPGFDFDHITTVDMSFCTSLRNFIQIGPPSAEKMTSCRFSRWRISAILKFMGPIMGSLKSPCTTSYRSSIDAIALAVRITGKLLRIDGYMLRGVWQALNCLSIHATFCVIAAGVSPGQTKNEGQGT